MQASDWLDPSFWRKAPKRLVDSFAESESSPFRRFLEDVSAHDIAFHSERFARRWQAILREPSRVADDTRRLVAGGYSPFPRAESV